MISWEPEPGQEYHGRTDARAPFDGHGWPQPDGADTYGHATGGSMTVRLARGPDATHDGNRNQEQQPQQLDAVHGPPRKLLEEAQERDGSVMPQRVHGRTNALALWDGHG